MNTNLEFLVLLFYYNRQKKIKNALASLERQTYNKFNVVIIDDGSDKPFTEVFPQLQEKYLIVRLEDTAEQKLTQGGSRMGYVANEAMEQIKTDVVLMLCDDDALIPDYLENLNTFFVNNPEANHCYSNVLFYNPNEESYLDAKPSTTYVPRGSTYNLNAKSGPTKCAGFDASQVAWRRACNVKFPYPQTRCHDAVVYKQLQNHGLCYPTGVYGQVKGAFEGQLGERWARNRYEYEI